MDLPTIPITSKSVLVVDSDDKVRKTVVKTLEIEGYIVKHAQSASAALSCLEQFQPDLIISDINLPGPGGNGNERVGWFSARAGNGPMVIDAPANIDFYQIVRNTPAWTAIPFIFLIRRNDQKEAQRARELGVEDYLTKPLDGDSLVRIVHARLLRSAELQVALIDQAYLETIEVLANTVEGRDPYTHGHIGRVSMYAGWLAEGLEWPKEQMRSLAFGARLHDIGKIVVPDHILKKPGGLTPEEWELMKQHPTAGGKILREIKHLKDALNYVLYHHERWDGNGYPHGLAGREIPMEGRLLAIADVYDALTSDRPYHPARPRAEVLRYLHERSGTDFDPDLVPIFIHVLEDQMRI